MSDIRKRLRDILNNNFSTSSDVYLNTEITSYSTRASKNSPNYIATSPSRFNLSNEFDNLKKRESVRNKIGKLKDFGRDMENFLNSSKNNIVEKKAPIRAQFSATLNALERSLKSPRRSVANNLFNSTQNFDSFSFKKLQSERSSSNIRPLVTSPNDCSLTKTKIKREIDSLTQIFNKDNKMTFRLNKPVISLDNKPEYDLSGKEYFAHSPTKTRKKNLVTAFNYNPKKKQDEVLSLRTLNFKSKNAGDKNMLVRNLDNNDVENFNKEFDFKRKQSLFEKFSQRRSVLITEY